MMVDEGRKDEAVPLVSISVSSFQRFDTIGWVTGRTSSLYKPVPLIPSGRIKTKGHQLTQVDRENGQLKGGR